MVVGTLILVGMAYFFSTTYSHTGRMVRSILGIASLECYATANQLYISFLLQQCATGHSNHQDHLYPCDTNETSSKQRTNTADDAEELFVVKRPSKNIAWYLVGGTAGLLIVTLTVVIWIRRADKLADMNNAPLASAAAEQKDEESSEKDLKISDAEKRHYQTQLILLSSPHHTIRNVLLDNPLHLIPNLFLLL